jgi:hypothetical protein
MICAYAEADFRAHPTQEYPPAWLCTASRLPKERVLFSRRHCGGSTASAFAAFVTTIDTIKSDLKTLKALQSRRRRAARTPPTTVQLLDETDKFICVFWARLRKQIAQANLSKDIKNDPLCPSTTSCAGGKGASRYPYRAALSRA